MADRESILLVRLDGVGDAALCIPALEGMRRTFPAASFGAVCSVANAPLFSGNVEHVHVYTEDLAVAEFGAQLQAQRYTRAIVATEEVAGYKLARLSGAPLRAGFWHGLQKPFKSIWQRAQLSAPVYRPAAWTRSPEHEVATMYRLAQALGAMPPVPSENAYLRTWLQIEQSEYAQVAAGALGFQISPKLLTGGWGPTGLAQLVSVTLEISGFDRAVLLASAQDENLACSVVERLPPATRGLARVDVMASLPLPRWLGVLDRVAALVTPDTGAAHVAGMLGSRVIDLFDEPDFDRLSQQWHPWAGESRCLVKPAWSAGVEIALGRQIGEAVGVVGRARSTIT